MLAGVLDGNESARLNQHLVRDQQVASAAGAGYDSTSRGPSLFTLDATPSTGKTVQDVETALRGEIALLVKDGVSEDELKRVKAQVMAGEVYKRDSVFYQAMQIGQLESIGLGYQAIPVMLEKLQAVTAEQVQQVAKEFLQDDNLTVAVLDPQPLSGKKIHQSEGGCQMFAKTTIIQPLGVAALCCISIIACATPNIQHWQSASGAKVLFVEDHDIPMLDVEVNFPAGSGFDTADKSGVAGLTHGLLDAGSDGLSEDEISRGMADIGAQFGGGFDQDRSSISLRTLSSAAERDKALDIMSRVLQHPLFPDAVFAREKVRLIAALKEEDTKPENIAEKVVREGGVRRASLRIAWIGRSGKRGKNHRPGPEAIFTAHITRLIMRWLRSWAM